MYCVTQGDNARGKSENCAYECMYVKFSWLRPLVSTIHKMLLELWDHTLSDPPPNNPDCWTVDDGQVMNELTNENQSPCLIYSTNRRRPSRTQSFKTFFTFRCCFCVYCFSFVFALGTVIGQALTFPINSFNQNLPTSQQRPRYRTSPFLTDGGIWKYIV